MQQWTNKITLIATLSDATDDQGFPIQTKNGNRCVPCNKRSVGTTEYYKAQQVGKKIEGKVEVHQCDYKEEQYALMNDKHYRVEKSYNQTDSAVVELTLCSLNADSVQGES